MLSRFRTLSLASVAVVATAAWGWSQAPVETEIRVVTEVPDKKDAEDETRALRSRDLADEINRRTTEATAQAENARLQAEEAGIRATKVIGDFHRFVPNAPFGLSLPQNPQAGFRVIQQPRTVYEAIYIALDSEEQAEQAEVAKQTAILNAEGTAEAKEAARAALSAVLAKQFDRDTTRREKEVVDLEERVKKLRDQVDKRKGAKDKIVGLRLDTILNEADGLGFPGQGTPSGAGFPGGGFSGGTITIDPAVPNFAPPPAYPANVLLPNPLSQPPGVSPSGQPHPGPVPVPVPTTAPPVTVPRRR